MSLVLGGGGIEAQSSGCCSSVRSKSLPASAEKDRSSIALCPALTAGSLAEPGLGSSCLSMASALQCPQPPLSRAAQRACWDACQLPLRSFHHSEAVISRQT